MRTMMIQRPELFPHIVFIPFSAQMIVFPAYAVRGDTQIPESFAWAGRSGAPVAPSAPYYAPARRAVNSAEAPTGKPEERRLRHGR